MKGRTLINFDTNFYTTNTHPTTQTVTLIGQQVTIEATPTEYTWHFGSGEGDQTTGDSTLVGGFQNVDASALGVGVSLRGSTAANAITGGAGDDVIDGFGGADVVAAGAGADTVTVRGSEASVDGGAGS